MIPVLLMLVYPGPASGRPAAPPAPRASDADRDIAADILCAAVADGRLTLDELDDRVAAALSARTMGELAVLIADLPDRRRTPPTAGPRLRPGDPGAGRAAPAGTRWSLIQSLADGMRMRARTTG
jgi:Domain of unknown function (DUF1707)